MQNRLLFTCGGKALQKVTELIQFVLKEAVPFLGEAEHLPQLSKNRFCPETGTRAPLLHIGATFLGETTFRLEYQHEML